MLSPPFAWTVGGSPFRARFSLLATLASAATLVLLTGAPQAFAETRYAAPSGTGTACTQASPCGVETAVEIVAQNGDEVVLATGDYNIGGELFVDRAINVHGAAGQPRPRILSSGGSDAVDVRNPSARVADLAIEYSGSLNGLFLLQGTAERVVVHNTSSGLSVCGTYRDAVLRDSVCWSAAASRAAIGVSSGGADVHTPRLRNVTAIATGANSLGVEVNTNSGAQAELRGKNVIARGALADLWAEADSSSSALIALDHSNFVTSTTAGSGTGASITGSPTNQNAAPLFANAAVGDFHQLAGSPTIDAGTTDSLLGTLDIDGQARNQGAAPDIGADEFNLLPPPGEVSNDFSFGKVKKNKRKGTAKLTVKLPGPGELDLAKTKKVKADEQSVEAAGKEKLSIKPKGQAKKKLNRKGKAKVEAKVTFTPTGGAPNTEGKKIKLVKR
jgi:hypothetical protein